MMPAFDVDGQECFEVAAKGSAVLHEEISPRTGMPGVRPLGYMVGDVRRYH